MRRFFFGMISSILTGFASTGHAQDLVYVAEPVYNSGIHGSELTWNLQDEKSADEKASDEDKPESVEDRIKALEKELKKISESAEKKKEEEKKKKEEDAKKKEEEAKKPSVKPRMRMHTDSNWFHQSDANRASVGDIQDGTYFRRARLGFDAKAFEITEYRLDFEMASGGGRPSIFDAYGKLTEVPVLGNVQLGHFREPFSLEALTSSNWFTFMERGLNNTFDPSRNWGIMTFDHNDAEDFTWAIGAFREGSDNFGDDIGDSGERAVTSRVTWLPYYDECSKGRYFWEIGGSHSFRDPDNRFAAGPGSAESSIVRYSGRPEDNLNEDGIGSTPSFIDTGVLGDVRNLNLYGIESSMNLGSVNIQGEYIASDLNRVSGDNYFHGAYGQVSWFLTGESRQWNRKTGMFDRAEVKHPFSFKKCQWGAWEVAARWNYLNLNDRSVSGGYLDATTVGLNWYLSPYTRLMFNYELVDLHDPVDGRSDASVFHTRLDVHF